MEYKACANFSHLISCLDPSIFQQCGIIFDPGEWMLPTDSPSPRLWLHPSLRVKPYCVTSRKLVFLTLSPPTGEACVLSNQFCCRLNLSQMLALITLYCHCFLVYILPKPGAIGDKRLGLLYL